MNVYNIYIFLFIHFMLSKNMGHAQWPRSSLLWAWLLATRQMYLFGFSMAASSPLKWPLKVCMITMVMYILWYTHVYHIFRSSWV